MKKINTFLRGTILLFFFMSFSGYSQDCEFSLEMIDSFGDGWNGASMSLQVNGVTVLSDVSASGYGTTLSFPVNNGDLITTIYGPAGSYPGETSYNILNNNGVVVQSGDDNNISVVATCAIPPDCQFSLEMIDSFGDGWNGASMSLQVNGITVLSNVSASGSGTTLDFGVNNGDVITTIYGPAGSYPSETSYNILNNLGEVVASGDDNNISTTVTCATATEYCVPDLDNDTDGDGVTNLVLGSTNFDLSADDDSYYDLTATSIEYQAGLDGNIQITFSTSDFYPYYTYIWIDINSDYVFDSGELFYSGQASGGFVTLDASFPMPETLGEFRMRIGTSDDTDASDPCFNGNWSVFIDATIEIIEAPCAPAVVAGTEILANCGANKYIIEVEISEINGATEITDGSESWPIAPGTSTTTSVGPFDSGVTVNLTIVNPDSVCNVNLGEFSYTCPPENDTCDNAIAIGCGGVETGSTEFANSEDLADCEFMDTSFPELNTAPGVWYTVVGTGGDIVLDLSESSFDTKIALYSGSCNGLVLEDCDDDGGTGLRSKLTFTSENETVYYVYVTGWNSSSGDYVLTVDCICDAYIVEGECVSVTYGYGPADGTSLTAVGQFGEAPYTYEWSTGETGETIFVAPAAQTVYSVTVTDNAGCSSEVFTTVLVEDISCGDNPNNVKVNVCHNGEQICVSPNSVQAHLNHGDSLGACDTVVDCDTPPLCDARLKVPGPDAIDVSTDIEISWGEATGLVQGYFLSVGTTEGGTEILDNLDVGNVLDYSLDGLLNFATTYYVTITPYNSIGSADNCGASSVFTTETGPWCGGPTVVCDDPYEGDTSIDGEVNGYLSYCGNDLNVEPGTWHTFIGTGGDVIASLCNSTYDTRIGIFTGDCSTISCVAGNNDNFSACGSGFRSEVEFSSIEGATYYIFVSGDDFSNPFTGPYTLELTCAEPPEPCTENEVTVNINFDDYPSETSWEITDNNDNDNVVASGDNYSGETFTSEVACLPDGCYTFTIYDSFDDGICCDYGSGSYTVTGTDTTISGGEFGASESTAFCVSSGNGNGNGNRDITTNGSQAPDWNLYPNPSTTGEVQLDLTNYINQNVSIQMMDFSGKVLTNNTVPNLQTPRYRLSTQGMPYGMYFVRVATDSGVSTKKLIIANK